MDPIIATRTPPRAFSAAKKTQEPAEQPAEEEEDDEEEEEEETEEETDEEEEDGAAAADESSGQASNLSILRTALHRFVPGRSSASTSTSTSTSATSSPRTSGTASARASSSRKPTGAGAGAGAGADDSLLTAGGDSSFDIDTDPSPSVHAWRAKKQRQESSHGHHNGGNGGGMTSSVSAPAYGSSGQGQGQGLHIPKRGSALARQSFTSHSRSSSSTAAATGEAVDDDEEDGDSAAGDRHDGSPAPSASQLNPQAQSQQQQQQQSHLTLSAFNKQRNHASRQRVLSTSSSSTRASTASGKAKSASGKGKSKRKSYSNGEDDDEATSSAFFERLRRLLLLVACLYALFALYVRNYESRALGFCDPAGSVSGGGGGEVSERSNSIVRARREAKLLQQEQRAQALAAASTSGLEGNDDEDALQQLLVSNVTLTSLVPSSWLPSSCTPCPTHGDCTDGQFLGCVSSDFLEKPSLVRRLVPAFASDLLLPLPYLAPTCVPDTQKLVLALELGAELERVLADWHGQVLCGRQAPYEGAPSRGKFSARERVDAGALPELHLKSDLHARMDEQLVDEPYFEQLWALALGEFERSGEIKRLSSKDQGQGEAEEDLLYAPRAITPLSCTVRLRFRAFLRRYRLLVLGLAALLGFYVHATRNYRRKRREAARVRELVQIALQRLQEQEYEHAVRPALNPEPFLATAQLRDHVLAAEQSTKARKRLWSKVARIVEENANVRTRQAQRRGEWARVWEWIGGGAGKMERAAPSPTPPPPAVEMSEKEAGASVSPQAQKR